MAFNRSALAFLMATYGIVCLASNGCGTKQPETFPVSGRVTYKGQPIARGLVAFYPAKGRMATGDIGPDGHYSLTTFHSGDGALPGRDRVTIDAKRIPNASSQSKSLKEESQAGGLVVDKVEWLVPQEYSRSETTPLAVEVTRSQNTINFDLPAQQSTPVPGVRR